MTNGLDHQLVRDYLADLDSALAGLTPERADELREQVTAHLHDAMPPDADDDLIASVLRRLGQPRDLVREAGGVDVRAIAVKAAERARRKRYQRSLAIAIGAISVAFAAWPSYIGAMHSVGSLEARGPSAWWYPQDAAHQVIAKADGLVQVTVPIRSGQQQGFVLDVYNPSNWTQTILGQSPTVPFLTPGAQSMQRFGVSDRQVTGGAEALREARYSPTGAIPPHQSRAIRLLWITTMCTEDGQTVDVELQLSVRVGWVTRTEAIELAPSLGLDGPSTGKYDPTGPVCQPHAIYSSPPS